MTSASQFIVKPILFFITLGSHVCKQGLTLRQDPRYLTLRCNSYFFVTKSIDDKNQGSSLPMTSASQFIVKPILFFITLGSHG